MSSPSVEMKMTSATAVMSPLCRLFVRALCVLGGRLTTEENVPTCEPAQRTDRARELAKKAYWNGNASSRGGGGGNNLLNTFTFFVRFISDFLIAFSRRAASPTIFFSLPIKANVSQLK